MSGHLLAAALTALAVWLWLPPDARLQRRARARRELPGWLAARPDAPALRTRIWSAALVGLAGWLVLGSGAVGLLLGVALAGVTVVVLGRLEPARTRRRRLQLVAELPEVLELLAAALEAGAPLRSAVQQVARCAPEAARFGLEQVSARVGIGFSDSEAWAPLADDPQWAPVAQDLARSADTGAGAARALRRHAEDARARRRDAMVERARAVGVRSVLPLMACFLPAFLLVGVVPIVAGLVAQLVQR